MLSTAAMIRTSLVLGFLVVVSMGSVFGSEDPLCAAVMGVSDLSEEEHYDRVLAALELHPDSACIEQALVQLTVNGRVLSRYAQTAPYSEALLNLLLEGGESETLRFDVVQLSAARNAAIVLWGAGRLDQAKRAWNATLEFGTAMVQVAPDRCAADDAASAMLEAAQIWLHADVEHQPSPLERLWPVIALHDTDALWASLEKVADPDDPHCSRLYCPKQRVLLMILAGLGNNLPGFGKIQFPNTIRNCADWQEMVTDRRKWTAEENAFVEDILRCLDCVECHQGDQGSLPSLAVVTRRARLVMHSDSLEAYTIVAREALLEELAGDDYSEGRLKATMHWVKELRSRTGTDVALLSSLVDYVARTQGSRRVLTDAAVPYQRTAMEDFRLFFTSDILPEADDFNDLVARVWPYLTED